MAALTRFSYEKMYRSFCRDKNIGRNDEVAAVTRFSYEKMYSRFAGIKILAVMTRWLH